MDFLTHCSLDEIANSVDTICKRFYRWCWDVGSYRAIVYKDPSCPTSSQAQYGKCYIMLKPCLQDLQKQALLKFELKHKCRNPIVSILYVVKKVPVVESLNSIFFTHLFMTPVFLHISIRAMIWKT